MKKILSLILAATIFIFSAFSANASVVEADPIISPPIISDEAVDSVIGVLEAMTTNRTFTVANTIPLYGLNNTVEYALLVFETKGYAIVDIKSEQIIEALVDGYNPYTNTDHLKYYAGPLNYLYKTDSGTIITTNNQIVSHSEIVQKSIDIAMIHSKMESSKAQKSANANQELQSAAANPASAIVSYSSYIINTLPFGNNVNGTCGSVAAGMMLTCLKLYVSGYSSLIPNTLPAGEPLHQLLTQYCEMASGGSTSSSVCSGLNNWFNLINNGYTANYVYLIQEGYAKTQIANNKTCVMALGHILGWPNDDHQAMVFGYYSNSNGDYFNAHLGWSTAGSSNSIINSSWTIGATWIV
jgi:hypothetical protein